MTVLPTGAGKLVEWKFHTYTLLGYRRQWSGDG
jgi:hypothetical protein